MKGEEQEEALVVPINKWHFKIGEASVQIPAEEGLVRIHGWEPRTKEGLRIGYEGRKQRRKLTQYSYSIFALIIRRLGIRNPFISGYRVVDLPSA